VTSTELAAVIQGIAPVVREYLTKSVVDLTTRVATAEVRVEMKAAETSPLLAALVELRNETSALRERVAVLETRPPMPGPPGDPGPPGKDGADGTAGLAYLGVYQDGKSYDRGELVTWAGSAWHCNEATTTKPGDSSKAWTLMVKRGRDGKDGKP
jgi:hypothetical protein